MLTCGLKALSTEDCVYGIDTCRLACGGHGYLNSSNLPRIFTTATSAITYEGENTVLLLQVARYKRILFSFTNKLVILFIYYYVGFHFITLYDFVLIL